MFTGIIQEVGTVALLQHHGGGARIHLSCQRITDSLAVGDSVAVNGVCLTAITFQPAGFQADIANETLRVTNLGSLRAGDNVNLERAMRADGRFDGHIVSGHIDTTAKIVRIVPDGSARMFRFRLQDPAAIRYCIERGSAAIDGISLTIFDLDDANGEFSISLIPHSQTLTTLPLRTVGDTVNVECDVIAKYVERLVQPNGTGSRAKVGLSLETLRQNGFA